MRIPISVSLVVLAVTGVFAESFAGSRHAGGRVRKSLGFGPELPHAVFNTSPEQAFQSSAAGKNSPFEVAESFVNHLLRRDGQLTASSHYELRGDSYTDDNTGVTHVYFRQLINGLEVSDGLINVNVKDGAVISYGDSFYRGSTPATYTSPATEQHLTTPWEMNCRKLGLTMNEVFREDLRNMGGGNDQVNMSPLSDMSELAQRLEHLYATNCGSVKLASDRVASLLADKEDDMASARDAVLTFMLAATPDENLQEDILSRYSEYLDGISSIFEPHLTSDGSVRPIERLTNVPDTVNPVKAYPAYAQVPTSERTVLALVWKLEVEMQDNWYEAAVSMHRPHKIVSVVDWAADAAIDPAQLAPTPKKPKKDERAEFATYNVFSWGINDPECGNRTYEKEGSDKLASPLGWHSIPAVNDPKSAGRAVSKDQINNYTTTWGNNGFAHENWEGRNNWEDNYRPDAGSSLSFNYTYDPKERDGSDSLSEAKKYINTTVTQLFYTVNLVHDLFYRYGFDEKSGNFQQDNFGRGGREGDAVIANAQDGSGYNNANFATPPDGQNGRCRMYLWNTAQPYRDGDLEAGIVIHELSHGLSTRLTGGPANSGCLGWGESGGMGEGWGDFFATVIRSTSTYSDYPMGAWAANRPNGIRQYPYSLNKTINPVTYKTLDKPGYWEVHSIGAVWAELLWVVAQKFIDKHGFSDSLFPPLPLDNGTIPSGDFYRPAEFDAQGNRKPLVPKHGNSLITQLVVNGMKLQKCMPGFLDARDAIIQADQVLTGGENYCLLYEGFAERGLGPNARVDGRTPWGGGIRTDDFDLPTACQQEKVPDTPDDGGDDDNDDDDENWINLSWEF